MFAAHCPRHGRTVLIPTSWIDGIDNTDHGMVARWHCSCGQHGTTTYPGRGVPASRHAARRS